MSHHHVRRHPPVASHGRLAARTTTQGSNAAHGHHHATIRRIEVAEIHIKEVAGRADEAGVLHPGGNLVMYHSLLVLVHDINTELQVVVRLQLVGLGFSILFEIIARRSRKSRWRI